MGELHIMDNCILIDFNDNSILEKNKNFKIYNILFK